MASQGRHFEIIKYLYLKHKCDVNYVLLGLTVSPYHKLKQRSRGDLQEDINILEWSIKKGATHVELFNDNNEIYNNYQIYEELPFGQPPMLSQPKHIINWLKDNHKLLNK